MTAQFADHQGDPASVSLEELGGSDGLSVHSYDAGSRESVTVYVAGDERPLFALAALVGAITPAMLSTSRVLARADVTEQQLINNAAANLNAVKLRREAAAKVEQRNTRRDELAERFAGVAMFDKTTSGLQSAIDHIIELEAAA